MITEDYVSFETAKPLKEKGFREWCSHCYGLDVRHNGKTISVDEECELKDEGRGDEIEYVNGGRFYNYWYDNKNKDELYAAPTLQMAMKWLREVHNLVIEPYRTACGYLYTISNIPYGSTKYDNSQAFNGDDKDSGQWTTWEGACNDGIKYCLENLI